MSTAELEEEFQEVELTTELVRGKKIGEVLNVEDVDMMVKIARKNATGPIRDKQEVLPRLNAIVGAMNTSDFSGAISGSTEQILEDAALRALKLAASLLNTPLDK